MAVKTRTPELLEHLLRIGSLEDAALVLSIGESTGAWGEAFAYHHNCCAPLPEGSPIDHALGGPAPTVTWRDTVPAAEGSAWQELQHLRESLGAEATDDPLGELAELRARWCLAAEILLLRTDTT